MKTPNTSPLFETIASLLGEPATGFRAGGPIDQALRLLQEKAKGRNHVFQPEEHVTEHAFITRGDRHLALYKHRLQTAHGQPCNRQSLTLYDLKAQKVFFAGHADDVNKDMTTIVPMAQPEARDFIYDRPAAFFTHYPQYATLFTPRSLFDFTKAEKIFLMTTATVIGLTTYHWLHSFEKNKFDLSERPASLTEAPHFIHAVADSARFENKTHRDKQSPYPPYPLPVTTP